ncbi:MAG: sialidase family protein [Planctomycetota bacterium]|nr:sialidase family protein [Planctomycetota bacterium]
MIHISGVVALRLGLLLCECWLFLASTLVADGSRPGGEEVFRTALRRQGDDKVHTYRIPGLAATPTGTLIAVFDVRHKNAGDLPGDIDIGMMRSTDNGETWSTTQIILDFDTAEKDSHGNGVGDPAVLVDRKTGHILVAGLWSKGNRAWNGSGPGLTPDETGQFVLTRSTDDGKTWSKPINITEKIAGRNLKWRLCFNGPGNGIQLRDGTLVFAAQFRDAEGLPHSCFIFSSDGGDTWTISPPAIPAKPTTSESQIVELADGSLLLSMRDESRSGKRAWAKFTWKDHLSEGKWGEPWFTVPDPTCMASLVSHPKGPLLFSNPNSAKQRVALTIRTSTDDGNTWSDGQLLDSRPCAYSCLAILKDGSIGVLYECGDKSAGETLTFARFPLSWINGPDGKR